MSETFVMTEDALENYGEEWRGVELVVISVATEYMPAKQFYDLGKPAGFHPGYDTSLEGMPLYDFARKDNGEVLNFSLYAYEVE